MRRDLLCLARPDTLAAALATVFSGACAGGCAGKILVRPHNKVDRTRPERWLRAGPQTRSDPNIHKLAINLKHNNPYVTLRKIHRWIKSATRNFKGNKARVLVKRTASQLIRARTLSGCNDWGILFAALARACGLPAVFVKAIHKEWARRWVEGQDKGPHMGHVFIEVFVRGKWILVDSTRGYYWTGYNPDEPNLPGGYYAYAKARDPWDMGTTNQHVLNRSLENIAEYLETRKQFEPDYAWGFLIPTLVVIAPGHVHPFLRQAFPKVNFLSRTVRSVRRDPGSVHGLDVLVLARKGELEPVMRKLADALDMDGRTLNDLTAGSAFPRLVRQKSRVVCVASASGPDGLKEIARSVLHVSPLREGAIHPDGCRPVVPVPKPGKSAPAVSPRRPASRAPVQAKPLSARLGRAARLPLGV